LKRIRIILVALLACLVMSCGDDGTGPPPKSTLPTYMNLAEKWHVLNNLQLSYNELRSDKYIEILDPDDFIYYLAPSSGPPDQWGYSEEVTIANHMLNKQGSNPILSIDLELVDFREAMWVEVDPTNSPGWFKTVVVYHYVIETQNGTIYSTSGNPAAEFVVHQVDDNGTEEWRLIRWRDLADASTALRRVSGPRNSSLAAHPAERVLQ
jgi:hypothetical protein